MEGYEQNFVNIFVSISAVLVALLAIIFVYNLRKMRDECKITVEDIVDRESLQIILIHDRKTLDGLDFPAMAKLSSDELKSVGKYARACVRERENVD